MAVRNFQCRYKIYTKKEIDDIIDGIETSIDDKQDKLTAGTNVSISDENVISATDTVYTAGDNIAISDQNVISATDTVYTAGENISISDENVISATGGSEYTAGDGIQITDGVIKNIGLWEVVDKDKYNTVLDSVHDGTFNCDVKIYFGQDGRFVGSISFNKGAILGATTSRFKIYDNYYTSSPFNFVASLFFSNSTTAYGYSVETKVVDKTSYYELYVNNQTVSSNSFPKKSKDDTIGIGSFVVMYRRKE